MKDTDIPQNWSLATFDEADRWLRSKGVPPLISTDVSYKVSYKMSLGTLMKLYDMHISKGSGSLLDEIVNWLKLYNIREFALKPDRCVKDVTDTLPVAGMVANRFDAPRLVPELVSSAVGIKTISDFGYDYLYTTTGLAPIQGNGLLTMHDSKTEVVTRSVLIERGILCIPKEVSLIETIIHNSCHRSAIIWADRIVARATYKQYRIKESDVAIIAARASVSVAKAVKDKLAFGR